MTWRSPPQRSSPPPIDFKDHEGYVSLFDGKSLDGWDGNPKFWMDIRIDGSGGSGIQYRSKTSLPWLANINTAVANNNGPVNLDWMTTGPQADFWPTTEHTGQTRRCASRSGADRTTGPARPASSSKRRGRSRSAMCG